MSTFGWIPHEERTIEQEALHHFFIGGMPKFSIVGATESSGGKRACLWDLAKAVNGGEHIATLYQQTGSCVGNGAWNAATYVMAVEIAKGEREMFTPIFLPYHYGRGRLHAGIHGRGEGSTGSGQAEAVRVDGVLAQTTAGLPAPSGAPNALTWGQDVEMRWSDGAGIDAKYIEAAKIHPIKSTALVSSYAEVRDALCNGYPVTVASNRGFQMKQREDKGKMWGVPSGSWNHQMAFIGVDDDAGRPGCYCMNSWGSTAHSAPIGGEPPGGFWVDAEVVDYMVRQHDSFAYSQFAGFPAQKLDFHVVG